MCCRHKGRPTGSLRTYTDRSSPEALRNMRKKLQLTTFCSRCGLSGCVHRRAASTENGQKEEEEVHPEAQQQVCSDCLVCHHRIHCDHVQMYVHRMSSSCWTQGKALRRNMQDTVECRSPSAVEQSGMLGSVTMHVTGRGGWGGWEGGGSSRLIRTCPVSSAAELGSGPAVFCSSGSMWPDSYSPPAAFYAPAPDGTCSAGPSHLGPVRR